MELLRMIGGKVGWRGDKWGGGVERTPLYFTSFSDVYFSHWHSPTNFVLSSQCWAQQSIPVDMFNDSCQKGAVVSFFFGGGGEGGITNQC